MTRVRRARQGHPVHQVSDSEQEEAQSDFATPVIQLGTQALRGGLQSLGVIDLVEVWKVRGNLMKFMQGAYRTWMRQALVAVSLGEERGDDLLQIRGWKLFFLIPRMFLYRPSRGGLVEEDVVSQSGPLSKGSVACKFGGSGECPGQAAKEIGTETMWRNVRAGLSIWSSW